MNLIIKQKTLVSRIKPILIKLYSYILSVQFLRRIYSKLIQILQYIAEKIRQFKSQNIFQYLKKLYNKKNISGQNTENVLIENSPSGIYSIVTKEKSSSERIRSIDILRGLVILAMVFVNDAYSVPGAAGIFLHLKSGQDGITIADTVFPAFLFIIGLTMPFSFGNRVKKGESTLQIWEHIVKRSLILLLVGFFMVNLHSIDRTGGMIEYRLWSFLMLTGVILFRISFPHSNIWMKRLLNILRTTGIALLIFLAFAYSSKNGTGLMQMRTQWWGIIGLIGWAYFISGVVYLILHKLPAGILGAAALLYFLYIADRAGMFLNLTIINSILNIGSSLGTHSAICVSGIALGMLISENLPENTHSSRISRAIMLGAGFASAAFMLHSLSDQLPMFKISKLNATPPWGLLSSAFITWIWALIYFISDVSKENKITKILEYAGRNALMAYIVSVQVIFGLSLLGIHFFQYEFYKEYAVSMGLWRALFFSISIVLFAGILEKLKIRLKL